MSLSGGALTRDAFLGGRLTLLQPRHGYRAATDPVLLAAFVPVRPGDRVLDLGCGVGTAGLCLARRVPGLDLHGLELQPDYADLARRNAAENDLPLEVHEGDLRAMPSALRALAFDAVLLNPPYFKADRASAAADPGRDRANREGAAELSDWLDAGLRRLRPGGVLAIIHRTGRLPEILTGLAGRAGAVDVLPIAPRKERPAGRVLVRARKGRTAEMKLWPPLTAHEGSSHINGGGSSTIEMNKVLRNMHALLSDTR
jgi:tRNA1(Val) A37 N6-methylase TrmN6